MSKKELRLYPPNYMRAITAVEYVVITGNKAVLHYVDGATQEGKYDSKNKDSFLPIVSSIQEAANAK